MLSPIKIPLVVAQKFGVPGDLYTSMGLKGHEGVDFSCPVKTPVYAAHDGYCVEIQESIVGTSGTRGLGINIFGPYQDHWVETQYWHLSEWDVTPNQQVRAGDFIGYSGNTGNSSGPHLHFGIKFLTRTNGNFSTINYDNGYNGWVDPMPYLTPDMFELFTADGKRDYAVLNGIRYWVLDPMTLARGDGKVWDSSKINQDPSVLNVPYGGAIFISNTDDLK